MLLRCAVENLLNFSVKFIRKNANALNAPRPKTTQERSRDGTAHSTPEFRLGVAFAFVATVLGAVAVTLFANGVEAWAGAVVGSSAAAIGIYMSRRERALLSDYQTVVATVSHWSRTESEGGYVYSVRYRFLGPDGQVYLGKSGSSDRALPQKSDNSSSILETATQPKISP